MELKGRDLYRVIAPDGLSAEDLSALISFYQPLTGPFPIMLYLTLLSEGRKQKTQENHNRLCSVMKCDIGQIEKARVALEGYLLLRTFVQESKERVQYVYALRMPLKPSAFLASNMLKAEFVQSIGAKQAELSAAKFTGMEISLKEYKEITSPVIRSNAAAGSSALAEAPSELPKYRFSLGEDQNIRFDYEKFFATTSPLVFPVELRSDDNLRLIGRLATLYGISADHMRILVSRCISVKDMIFHQDKLRLLAQKARPDITEADDPYSLPPLSFLQSKQNGAEVSLADRAVLEYLSLKMNFSPEVTNILVEHILNISQNRLVPKFVEMVAGEWARDGVRTKEDALAQRKKTFAQKNVHTRKKIPEYMENKNVSETSGETAVDLDEIREMMKKMGEK